ncbi:MAG: DUF6600 domain-containing protein [Pyrinomonadaceae bacterium]
MRFNRKISWALWLGLTLLLSAAAFGVDVEDDAEPDVTARVSRISFIRGDVQIRREGREDWERAVLNLPIVEGDELMTDANARLEVQLNLDSYIRLAENSHLKVVGLKDGAVALSLSEGVMNASLTRFDKDSAFFEVDAPRTTIAVQRSGSYRIDAGRSGTDGEVRISVTNNGEARVYADNSGFTLKDGRSASFKVDGPLAGEWDMFDATRFADEFDSWTLERDSIIAKSIDDAYYGKYYDQDIFGAEDLSDNGEWIYSNDYGSVWRPYRSAISSYSNWSPYRYGQWRWVPPYGWTWVNDEPWAWATYHHGRWFFDRGHWYWTPYGHIRRSRSWWYPALVGVTIINTNVYWYPLPRGFGYFNYNHCFGGWGGPRGGHNGWPRGGHNNGPRGGHQGGNNNGGNGGGHNGGPVTTPTTPGYVGPLPGQLGPSVFTNKESARIWQMTPPLLRVPPGAVVGTPLSSFGRGRTGAGSVSDRDARIALSKPLGENKQVRILPTYEELDGRVSTTIRSEKPREFVTRKTGAMVRPSDSGPMDRVLRTTKVLGGRDPVRPEAGLGDRTIETRKTGAVTRPPVRLDQDDPVRPESPIRRTKTEREIDAPVRPEPRTIRESKPREDRQVFPVRPEPPRREPAPRKREDPVRPEPRYVPPTRSAPIRPEPPRSAPVRPAPPRSSPPPRSSSPAPSKPSSPKSEPVRNAPSPRKKRDNL